MRLLQRIVLALLLAPNLFADQTGKLGTLVGANFNSTADQAITLRTDRYRILRITVQNCSASLTLAAGGFYTTTAKGGTAIVASTQVYTALTGPTKVFDAILASAAVTDILTANPIYLSLTTAQGSTATCDVSVFGDVLP